MLLVAMLLGAPQPYFPPRYERSQVHCFLEGRTVPIVSSFTRDWYGKHLRAAGEPSLYLSAVRGKADSLRFTWLPTFDAPVFVRIEGLTGRHPRLIAIRLSGQGGYDPGVIADRLDRPLTAAEADDLKRRLVDANPLAMAPVECGIGGMDGSQWIIERASGHRYKMVDRWSPDRGPVRSAGMAMLRLTGWKFGAIY